MNIDIFGTTCHIANAGPTDGQPLMLVHGAANDRDAWYDIVRPLADAGIRVMLGGAHDPAAPSLADDELAGIARADLRTTMGLTTAPMFTRVIRHAIGIPQYTEGHLERLARIERRLEEWPGLFVAGNGYRGVAINACVADAVPLARKILRR